MLSIEEIYNQYAMTVYRYLLSRTQDEDLAEELTQETFYQAVKSIHRFDGKSKILTWLIGIAKNLFYQNRRKNPVMSEFTDYIEKADSAEEEALASFEKKRILQAVHKLGEPMCEVIQLRIYAGFSYREIGEIMGRTENWARVTFYRAKEKLRKEIDQDE
ncbi:MAG: sigma-70 family RNA polymerase sigma factor [Lachnospiraceae bacterium]|nr:sigma-70 family RNA polymerase sigma factor [Lachnospiraceae bacterium]